MNNSVYFTVQSYRRYFKLTFASYSIQDEFRLDLEHILYHLKVYEEDPNGNKKEPYRLYYNDGLSWYLPSAFLGDVFMLLRGRYPDREHYQLIDLCRHEPAKMDLKIKPSYKLRDYQEQYHDLIVKGKEDRIFVDLRTGTGKASWVKSKVLTMDGFKELRSLEVGDHILGLKKPTKVKAIHPQGKKTLIKLTTQDKRTHICTDDHHWEVLVGKKAIPKVIKTKQMFGMLKRRVLIQIPYVIPKTFYDVTLFKNINMVGYIGDKIKPRNYRNMKDPSNVEALGNFRKISNSVFTDLNSDEKDKKNALEFLQYTPYLHNVLKLGLLYDVLHDEMTTIERTDNGVYTFTLRFEMEEVREHFRLLLLSMNVVAETSNLYGSYDLILRIQGIDDTRSKNNEDWSPINAFLTWLEYATEQYEKKMEDNEHNAIGYSALMRFEELDEDDAICIEVEDPEALYVVDDFLVTHNSFISTCAVVSRAKRTGYLLLPRYIDKWEEDFLEYTNIKKNRIYKVKGRESIEELLKDKNYKNYDVILFSIRTLYNLWKEFERGDKSISPLTLFTDLEIGTLVSDESHQELNAVFKILTYSNVEKIIGMSATYISSNASERRIQELLFPFNTRASNLVEFDNHIEYFDCPYTLDSSGGMIKHKSFQGYSQIIFETNILKNRTLMLHYYDMIFQLFEKDFLTRRVKGDKVLVYFGLVEMCKNFVSYLKGRDEIKENKLDIRKYTQEDDYETIKVGDVIVSTMQSLSTAFTVPGLISIYNTVSVRSPKANLQSMGRLRKLDRPTKFYNVYARNLNPHKVNAKNRIDQSRNFVKSIGRIDLGYVSKH